MRKQPKIVNTGKVAPKIGPAEVARALGAELVGGTPDKRTEPTFGFIGRDGNERLYELEAQVVSAIECVVKHREAEYNEAKWSCALPEAMAAALDSFQHNHVEPAVLHWIEEQLDPRLQRFRVGTNWDLLDKLAFLLERIKAENERPE